MNWLPEGGGYTTWEDSKDTPARRDLVQHDPATGKTEVLVPGADLHPAWRGSHRSTTTSFEGRRVAADLHQLPGSSGDRNTRGDYWVLDRATRLLRKLGGDAMPATLMFAKLAPVGPRVAYVRNNNLYVEELPAGRITPLTHSKSADEINGTFDWVYEEEFGLRDGFRWSPDGGYIALLAARHSRACVNILWSIRPMRSTPRSRPSSTRRSASSNAACRVGSRVGRRRNPQVAAAMRATRGTNYVAYLEWSRAEIEPDPAAIQPVAEQPIEVIERPIRPISANPDGNPREASPRSRMTPGSTCRTTCSWHRKATARELVPLAQRARTAGGTSISATAIARSKPQLLTPGDFDVIQIAGIDQQVSVRLLHRLARQRDPEVPLPRPPRRPGARNASPRRTSPARTTTRSRRTADGPSTTIPPRTRRRWSS